VENVKLVNTVFTNLLSHNVLLRW